MSRSFLVTVCISSTYLFFKIKFIFQIHQCCEIRNLQDATLAIELITCIEGFVVTVCISSTYLLIF